MGANPNPEGGTTGRQGNQMVIAGTGDYPIHVRLGCATVMTVQHF